MLELIGKLVRPGDHCIDVGANIGVHSLAIAAACGPSGRVLALEPDPENAAVCRRNLVANGCTNVELLEVAASDVCGTQELFLNRDNRGDHRLYLPDGETRLVTTVPTARLDSLLTERRLTPALIKIDVQGWEWRVLAGASGSIRERGRFVLITEFWSEGLTGAGSSPREYCALLDALDLDLYEINEPGWYLRRVSARRGELLDHPRETNLLGIRGISEPLDQLSIPIVS